MAQAAKRLKAGSGSSSTPASFSRTNNKYSRPLTAFFGFAYNEWPVNPETKRPGVLGYFTCTVRITHHHPAAAMPVITFENVPLRVATTYRNKKRTRQQILSIATKRFQRWVDANVQDHGLSQVWWPSVISMDAKRTKAKPGNLAQYAADGVDNALKAIQQMRVYSNGLAYSDVGNLWLDASRLQHVDQTSDFIVSAAKFSYRLPGVKLNFGGSSSEDDEILDRTLVKLAYTAVAPREESGDELDAGDATGFLDDAADEADETEVARERKTGPGLSDLDGMQDISRETFLRQRDTLLTTERGLTSVGINERVQETRRALEMRLSSYRRSLLLQMVRKKRSSTGDLNDKGDILVYPFHEAPAVVYSCPMCNRLAWCYDVPDQLKDLRVRFCGLDRCQLLGLMTRRTQAEFQHMKDPQKFLPLDPTLLLPRDTFSIATLMDIYESNLDIGLVRGAETKLQYEPSLVSGFMADFTTPDRQSVLDDSGRMIWDEAQPFFARLANDPKRSDLKFDDVFLVQRNRYVLELQQLAPGIYERDAVAICQQLFLLARRVTDGIADEMSGGEYAWGPVVKLHVFDLVVDRLTSLGLSQIADTKRKIRTANQTLDRLNKVLKITDKVTRPQIYQRQYDRKLSLEKELDDAQGKLRRITAGSLVKTVESAVWDRKDNSVSLPFFFTIKKAVFKAVLAGREADSAVQRSVREVSASKRQRVNLKTQDSFGAGAGAGAGAGIGEEKDPEETEDESESETDDDEENDEEPGVVEALRDPFVTDTDVSEYLEAETPDNAGSNESKYAGSAEDSDVEGMDFVAPEDVITSNYSTLFQAGIFKLDNKYIRRRAARLQRRRLEAANSPLMILCRILASRRSFQTRPMTNREFSRFMLVLRDQIRRIEEDATEDIESALASGDADAAADAKVPVIVPPQVQTDARRLVQQLAREEIRRKAGELSRVLTEDYAKSIDTNMGTVVDSKELEETQQSNSRKVAALVQNYIYQENLRLDILAEQDLIAEEDREHNSLLPWYTQNKCEFHRQIGYVDWAEIKRQVFAQVEAKERQFQANLRRMEDPRLSLFVEMGLVFVDLAEAESLVVQGNEVWSRLTPLERKNVAYSIGINMKTLDTTFPQNTTTAGDPDAKAAAESVLDAELDLRDNTPENKARAVQDMKRANSIISATLGKLRDIKRGVQSVGNTAPGQNRREDLTVPPDVVRNYLYSYRSQIKWLTDEELRSFLEAVNAGNVIYTQLKAPARRLMSRIPEKMAGWNSRESQNTDAWGQTYDLSLFPEGFTVERARLILYVALASSSLDEESRSEWLGRWDSVYSDELKRAEAKASEMKEAQNQLLLQIEIMKQRIENNKAKIPNIKSTLLTDTISSGATREELYSMVNNFQLIVPDFEDMMKVNLETGRIGNVSLRDVLKTGDNTLLVDIIDAAVQTSQKFVEDLRAELKQVRDTIRQERKIVSALRRARDAVQLAEAGSDSWIAVEEIMKSRAANREAPTAFGNFSQVQARRQHGLWIIETQSASDMKRDEDFLQVPISLGGHRVLNLGGLREREALALGRELTIQIRRRQAYETARKQFYTARNEVRTINKAFKAARAKLSNLENQATAAPTFVDAASAEVERLRAKLRNAVADRKVKLEAFKDVKLETELLQQDLQPDEKLRQVEAKYVDPSTMQTTRFLFRLWKDLFSQQNFQIDREQRATDRLTRQGRAVLQSLSVSGVGTPGAIQLDFLREVNNFNQSVTMPAARTVAEIASAALCTYGGLEELGSYKKGRHSRALQQSQLRSVANVKSLFRGNLTRRSETLDLTGERHSVFQYFRHQRFTTVRDMLRTNKIHSLVDFFVEYVDFTTRDIKEANFVEALGSPLFESPRGDLLAYLEEAIREGVEPKDVRGVNPQLSVYLDPVNNPPGLPAYAEVKARVEARQLEEKRELELKGEPSENVRITFDMMDKNDLVPPGITWDMQSATLIQQIRTSLQQSKATSRVTRLLTNLGLGLTKYAAQVRALLSATESFDSEQLRQVLPEDVDTAENILPYLQLDAADAPVLTAVSVFSRQLESGPLDALERRLAATLTRVRRFRSNILFPAVRNGAAAAPVAQAMDRGVSERPPTPEELATVPVPKASSSVVPLQDAPSDTTRKSKRLRRLRRPQQSQYDDEPASAASSSSSQTYARAPTRVDDEGDELMQGRVHPACMGLLPQSSPGSVPIGRDAHPGSLGVVPSHAPSSRVKTPYKHPVYSQWASQPLSVEDEGDRHLLMLRACHLLPHTVSQALQRNINKARYKRAMEEEQRRYRLLAEWRRTRHMEPRALQDLTVLLCRMSQEAEDEYGVSSCTSSSDSDSSSEEDYLLVP